MDRDWMYDMVDPSRRLKPRFINGVYEFVSKAMEQISYTQDGGIRCPCIKCICEKILKPSLVRAHLLQYGFKPNYKIWVLHGEQGSNEDNLCHASSNYEDMNYVDKFGSIQNKLNQSSTRGRALHSTGRKSHVDIALGLEHKYGRPVEPDELFMETHTKKDGAWVDTCPRQNYETYHERLKAIQTNNSEGSTSDIQSTIKPQCRKDVVGGKRKGRCYGTADLSANIRHGVSSITQPNILPSSIDYITENEQLRRKVMETNQIVNQINQNVAILMDRIQMLEQKLATMERHQPDTSTSTSQVHPYYAEQFDDQPVP